MDGRTCALGAGLDAIGKIGTIEVKSNEYMRLYEVARHYWPILSMNATHPVKQELHLTHVMSIITSLNDTYQWSREKIAEWVAEFEAAHNVVMTDDTCTCASCTKETHVTA